MPSLESTSLGRAARIARAIRCARPAEGRHSRTCPRASHRRNRRCPHLGWSPGSDARQSSAVCLCSQGLPGAVLRGRPRRRRAPDQPRDIGREPDLHCWTGWAAWTRRARPSPSTGSRGCSRGSYVDAYVLPLPRKNVNASSAAGGGRRERSGASTAPLSSGSARRRRPERAVGEYVPAPGEAPARRDGDVLVWLRGAAGTKGDAMAQTQSGRPNIIPALGPPLGARSGYGQCISNCHVRTATEHRKNVVGSRRIRP